MLHIHPALDHFGVVGSGLIIRQAGSWSLVSSDISISPAIVEDNVGSAKRFYVLVPAGSGNPFP
jgi:hypothetical protein